MSRETATPGPKGESSGSTPLHVPDCKELRAFEIVGGALCRQRERSRSGSRTPRARRASRSLPGRGPGRRAPATSRHPKERRCGSPTNGDVEHDAVYGDGGAAVQLHHLQPTGVLDRPRRLKRRCDDRHDEDGIDIAEVAEAISISLQQEFGNGEPPDHEYEAEDRPPDGLPDPAVDLRDGYSWHGYEPPR